MIVGSEPLVIDPWVFACKDRNSEGHHSWKMSDIRPGCSYCTRCKIMMNEEQTRRYFGN